MFNDRGGWGNKGGWRGNGCPPRAAGRGNFRNQFDQGFSGGIGGSIFRGGAQAMGFSLPKRGFSNRGFPADAPTFRGRGYGKETRTRRGSFSAGDQSLRKFGMGNIEGGDAQADLDRVKDKSSFQQSAQSFNDCSVNSSNLITEEKVNQSPDISSSTASPEKRAQSTAGSSILADSYISLQSLSSLSPSQRPTIETATAASNTGVIKYEPCDVGIVGAEVRFYSYQANIITIAIMNEISLQTLKN